MRDCKTGGKTEIGEFAEMVHSDSVPSYTVQPPSPMSLAAPASTTTSISTRRTRTLVVDVHALHKSATMFLFAFFRHLAPRLGLELVSENHDPPDVYLLGRSQLIGREDAGVCRCPIRTFDLTPTKLPGAIDQRRIFHVRDPRDMLVSEYFSFGWIHPTGRTPLADRRRQIQRLSIDEYVIRQSQECSWPLDQKFASLLKHRLDPTREIVVRYEDLVLQFPRWCRQVLGILPVRRRGWLAGKLAWRYRREFRVRGERMRHKRRIIPGDFRDKLQPATIAVLNERFAEVLDRFGYAE